ncbi:MAG TPA: hypothetical protein PKU96_05295 [bacterium]|nr:hypothetical protein [bacterium]HQC50227.1 hypothetical protein [bacterium]HQH80035.1 hypothetical protein [bacterium]
MTNTLSFPYAVSGNLVPTAHYSPVTVVTGSPIKALGDDDLLVIRG